MVFRSVLHVERGGADLKEDGFGVAVVATVAVLVAVVAGPTLNQWRCSKCSQEGLSAARVNWAEAVVVVVVVVVVQAFHGAGRRKDHLHRSCHDSCFGRAGGDDFRTT